MPYARFLLVSTIFLLPGCTMPCLGDTEDWTISWKQPGLFEALGVGTERNESFPRYQGQTNWIPFEVESLEARWGIGTDSETFGFERNFTLQVIKYAPGRSDDDYLFVREELDYVQNESGSPAPVVARRQTSIWGYFDLRGLDDSVPELFVEVVKKVTNASEEQLANFTAAFVDSREVGGDRSSYDILLPVRVEAEGLYEELERSGLTERRESGMAHHAAQGWEFTFELRTRGVYAEGANDRVTVDIEDVAKYEGSQPKGMSIDQMQGRIAQMLGVYGIPAPTRGELEAQRNCIG